MTSTTRATLVLAALCAAGTLRAQGRTPEPTRDTALVVFDDDGLRIHSADHRKQLKVRAYVVIDSRNVLSDTNDASASGLQLRRSRVTFDANLFPGIAARVMYDVAAPSGPSPIQDAYVDAGLGGGWWLRAGKQKTPFGLERYMSISAQLLPERSIASNLHPGRDVGLLVTGPLGGEHVEVALGMFDGAPDGGTTQDNDTNDDKDFTYRIWFKPVRKKVNGAEQGWGFAYNGTTGVQSSPSASGTHLPTFKTPALLQWFGYSEASGVHATGRHSRNGAFTYLHQGPLGLMAEYLATSQVVSRGASTATIGTTAWVADAQYTLTGEPSAQEGITPHDAFDPEKGHWGAWQVGARVAGVKVADEAFPLYADSTASARQAVEAGVGLNWYITRLTKMQIAYEHTAFTGGAKFGDKRAEEYVQLRWQAYF